MYARAAASTAVLVATFLTHGLAQRRDLARGRGFEVVDAIASRHGLEWRSSPAEALIANWRAERAFLVKPLNAATLLDAISNAVSNAAAGP